MKMSRSLTGAALVGLFFILMSSTVALADQMSFVREKMDELNGFQDQSLYSLHRESNRDLGVLEVDGDVLLFPWHISNEPARPFKSGSDCGGAGTCAQGRQILLDGNNSTATVRTILAINSEKRMDLIERCTQDGNDTGKNSLHVEVAGAGHDSNEIESMWDTLPARGMAGDEMAGDEMTADDVSGARGSSGAGLHYAGNHLSINVHDITVSAIGSVKGASASAISNIIIEPVQIIVLPSEVKEKLI